MIKKITFLSFILLIIGPFSACEFSRTKTVSVQHNKTISADYKISSANFTKDISSIGVFEKVEISTSVHEEDGEETHSITILLINPESAPETQLQLLGQAKEIEAITRENIRNIESFDKIVVDYSQKLEKNGIQKNITFKTETAI